MSLALTPAAGMTPPSRSFLTNFRREFFELVDAIVQSSSVLLSDARDREHLAFSKDLDVVHVSGRRLRELAVNFFDLEEEPGFEQIEKALRHDMGNALNVIINYCAEWIEDCKEDFLTVFLSDLKELHTHGKECHALLNRIRAIQLGTGEEVQAGLTAGAAEQLASLLDPLPAHTEEAATAIEPGFCLVVDDNPHNRDILSRLLHRQGHKVETAIHGLDALDKIRRQAFDLVLLDIMMPEMNGFQLLHHLKADPVTRSLPVIMISALDDTEAVVRCIAMGAEDYLPRPFNPLLLKARIGACLEKKRFQDRENLYLRQIEHEKKRADELLHVILPNQIVAELKTKKVVKPRRYENVAVLFADLVGFTKHCDEHPPEEVVEPLQTLVEAWENSALRYGVEKIKTIGDAFMAAAGLLTPAENPVLSCVRCGLEMIAETQQLPNVKWNLRVGIHIGPVVAGIVGQRQYLFDLWGDTVNTAARMESNGKPGRITLTEQAWERIAHLANAETGVVEPKGKGEMTVYRIGGLRPEPGRPTDEEPCAGN